MVYDTDLDITWVSDANLFKTQADASGNPAAFVQNIITANGGVIHDPLGVLSGSDDVWNLSADDFDTSNGRMSWYGARAWANSLSYGGVSDWRLPNANPAEAYFAYESSSELGHLFYSELGGTAGNNIPDTSTFSHEQALQYWSTGDDYFPYLFTTSGGFQSYGINYRTTHFRVWAVRSGDVAAVPLPGAVWLFGTGLLGWLGAKRRANIR